MAINYDDYINLDSVTIGDCLNLLHYENMITIINDGRVISFEKEERGDELL